MVTAGELELASSAPTRATVVYSLVIAPEHSSWSAAAAPRSAFLLARSSESLLTPGFPWISRRSARAKTLLFMLSPEMLEVEHRQPAYLTGTSLSTVA